MALTPVGRSLHIAPRLGAGLLLASAMVPALWPRAYGAADPAAPVSRVEARSADLLAVGLVRADKMTLHVSSLIDNAPVHDAVITVLLRGSTHPTLAEADGSYSLQTKELAMPGSAGIEFQVVRGELHETLKGTLDVSTPGPADDQGSARQLGWWVLNFGVCIGFLLLLSRRKKAAQRAES